MQSYPSVDEALQEIQHSRTSCSDEDVSNYYTTAGRGGYPRCMRCLLLKHKENPSKYPIQNLTKIITFHVQVKDND